MQILCNMKLIDMISPKVYEHKIVIIEGERIKEILDEKELSRLPRQDIIDLSGKYLIPGLFNLHAHVTIPFLRDIKLSIYPEILRQVQKNLTDCIQSGITTVRDLGALPKSIRSYQNKINLGEMEGPRIVFAGSMIVYPGGVPEFAPYFTGIKKVILGGQFAERPSTVRQVQDCVRRMINQGADWIKTTHGDQSLMMGKGSIPHFPDNCYEALVNEAHRYGKKVAMHHTSANGFRKGVQFSVDTLEHCALDELTDQDIASFVEKGIAIIPTLQAYGQYMMLAEIRHMLDHKGDQYLEKSPYASTSGLLDKLIKGISESEYENDNYYDYQSIQKQFPLVIDNIKRLHKARAIIGFGTDVGSDFGFFALTYKELEHLVTAGMSNFEALCTATITSAKILGFHRILGSIEAGKLADLVLIEGNPLDSVSEVKNVNMVWKEGQIVYRKL